jgi:hypothetical protein
MHFCPFGIWCFCKGAGRWRNGADAGPSEVIMLVLKECFRIRALLRGSARGALGCGRAIVATHAQRSNHRAFGRSPWLSRHRRTNGQSGVRPIQDRIESALSQYTFMDKTPVDTLDNEGMVRIQHTDICYVTPTAYEFFSLHLSRGAIPSRRRTWRSSGIESKPSSRPRGNNSPTELHEISEKKCGSAQMRRK